MNNKLLVIAIMFIFIIGGGLVWYYVNDNKNSSINNTNDNFKIEDCLAAGGQKEYNTDGNAFRCYYPYSDAGKECTSSDQCEGDCVTHKLSDLGKKGTCQTSTSVFTKCETPIEKSSLRYQIGDIGIGCSTDNWQNICDSACEK